MVKIKLQGIAEVTSKGKTYRYAWRGGPRLNGEPGSPEFMASPAFTGLADTTRQIWTRWLDRIVEHFGELRVAQFDRPDKIRPLIRRWRDKWADKPRSADYAIQVLSRVLSHAVDLDKISANPCEGIKTLYSNDRADIIWTDDDLKALKGEASPEVWHAVNLAAHTGLRAGDLKRLSWSHISDEAISIPTSKSRGGITAFVPLYDDLRAVLASIPKRSPVVLTNEKGRPWADGVNGTSFRNARDKALPGRDLHFHDLRGTAATRFHQAGLTNREIAEIMAWEETHVEKIIRRYVSRSAVTASIVRRLNKTEKGT